LQRITISIDKAAQNQLDQGWVQLVDVWSAFWWLDPRVRGGGIREIASRDAGLDRRWIAAIQPLGAKGVASIHKELEYKHAQGKSIMLWLAYDAANDQFM